MDDDPALEEEAFEEDDAVEEAFDEPDEPAAAADEPDADDEPEALDSELEEACDASEAEEPPATADEAFETAEETAEETAPPLAADELSAALTAITARENIAVDVNFIIIILTIVILVA